MRSLAAETKQEVARHNVVQANARQKFDNEKWNQFGGLNLYTTTTNTTTPATYTSANLVLNK